MRGSAEVTIDRCPLCDGQSWVHDSVPDPNLYSEKLAILLHQDERDVLEAHANWRCTCCGLIVKRRWFPESVLKEVFGGAVAVHPRGWDCVLDRFSAKGVQCAFERWAAGVENSVDADIRRGERELRSIIDSIEEPSGFDQYAVLAMIEECDTRGLRGMSAAIAGSIGRPAPFKRFAGFRSSALWDYLQRKTGGFGSYAEVGCPLWGLLPLAAEAGARAALLLRDEPNYWSDGCQVEDIHCAAKLLSDQRISGVPWLDPDRYEVIGIFQYLDHLVRPRRFLEELFAKADSAAVILDSVCAPVAIQHVTGWTKESLAYVAHSFGKRVDDDFDAIRPSGNVLYLLGAAS